MSESSHMSGFERRVAFLLAGIFSTRMLGLFMILPVFAIYAKQIAGYTPFLAGLALGIYGLTQAFFQIPLGLLSDRIGRKPVIIGGLLVFIIGSVVAAMADSLWGIILGRGLQGAGAIASAVMALAADLTREEHRVKVMALIGISIGASFAVALVIGPLIHGWAGISGIFWVTAGLAIMGVVLVVSKVPTPTVSRFRRDTEVEMDWIGQALSHPQLLRLDISIFLLHFILMSSFVVVPVLLAGQLTAGVTSHWKVYLPVLLSSMIVVSPFIFLAEKKQYIKQLLTAGIGLIAFSQLAFSQFATSFAGLVILLLLFFIAFNLLEALLPSLVSKMAPVEHKGTAMGAYSTSQFIGVFLGGIGGGWCVSRWGNESVFLMNMVLALLWLVLIWRMPQPDYHSSYLLNVGVMDEQQARQMATQLTGISGVVEALVIATEGVAYLKVDLEKLDQDALAAYSVSPSEV